MEEPVISFIVNKLGDLLVQESIFLLGVRDQVEQLRAELNRMQCFLESTSGIKYGDDMLKNWQVEVRELAYEAEYIIETFVLQVSSRSEEGVLKRFASSIVMNEGDLVHKVGSRIATINVKIRRINTSLQIHGIRRTVSSGSSMSSGSKICQHAKDDFVRLEGCERLTVRREPSQSSEEDVNRVVQKLVEDDNCRVVSIYGLGGLGKTTLARKIFHHKEIRSHFDDFAWELISQQYHPRDVLQGLFLKLDSYQMEVEKMGDGELVHQLYEIQRAKKCLVVLDNIRSMDAWYSLQYAFPNGNTSGSKIMITTRDERLGIKIDPSCFLYQPRYLDLEDESWHLLKSKALPRTHGTDSKIDQEMEVEGRKIANQCGGLPLPIIVLGGLLAKNHTLARWKEVYRDIQSTRGSVSQEKENVVSKVLSLSYHDLPYSYKPCFIYFSNFPEDCEIPAKKLCHLWIAEGLVSADDKLEKETMMDVAERYLEELALRCIVQVQVRKSTGKIKNCRIHNMTRELCLEKAKMHNFLNVLRLQGETGRVRYSSTSTAEIRKLAVYLNGDVKKVELAEAAAFQHLRSILFFRPSIYKHRIRLESNFKNFKLLTTLDLEGFSLGEESLEGIGKLFRLRYLSLKNCLIPKLPPSICNLGCLQTLNLGGNFVSYGVIVLQNMEQLRQLHIGCLPNFSYKRFKLHGLTNLETLEGFDVRNCDVNDLCKLNNLRQLDAVFSMNDNQSLTSFVKYLSNISAHHLRQTSLKIGTADYFSRKDLVLLEELLGCGHIYKLELRGRLPQLPEFHCSTSSLVNLTLEISQLKEDPMPILERLPKLQKLFLDSDAFIGNTMVCSIGGFPQLKMLILRNLDSLKDWRVEKGAMTNLSTLRIIYCRNLKMVPEGLRFITTLEEISIEVMPKPFVTRLQGEDFYKVRHVSSVKFVTTLHYNYVVPVQS